MSRILVVGARGLLGSSLCPQLERLGYTVIGQSRRKGTHLQFDPTDSQAWEDTLNSERPDAVVNLAAATNVDRCESNPQLAYDANVSPIMALVRAAINCDQRPHLVHISSDQVYDGLGPHREEDARPCNVYAMSKLASELVAEKLPATIMRTNFFGASKSSQRQSFSDWIVDSLRAKKPITVFNDVLFNALHLDSLCEVIACALEVRPCGTINVGTAEGISKADFAIALAARLALPTSSMQKGSIEDSKMKARRPRDMRMNQLFFEQSFSIPAPSMSEQIDRTARDYHE
jgi:dTDP-4-dehydrorhamnose reductase